MREKIGYRRHVFVCLNEREPDNPKGCCKHRGADAVFNALKVGAAKAGLGEDVRINRAGCMEFCKFGPSVVVYPEAVWYTYVDRHDIDEIIDSHLINGRVVDRLRI